MTATWGGRGAIGRSDTAPALPASWPPASHIAPGRRRGGCASAGSDRSSSDSPPGPMRTTSHGRRSTGCRRARARVTCGRSRRERFEVERVGHVGGKARQSALPIRDAVPRDARPRRVGKAPRPPVVELEPRWLSATVARRSISRGTVVGIGRPEEGQGDVPPVGIGPAQAGEVIPRAPRRRRRRRRSVAQRIADRDGHEAAPALVRHRSASRASTIGSSSSSERMTGTPSGTSSGRKRCGRSIRTPLDPDAPRALDIGVDVVADVDHALRVARRPARAPTGRSADAASRSRCARWPR